LFAPQLEFASHVVVFELVRAAAQRLVGDNRALCSSGFARHLSWYFQRAPGENGICPVDGPLLHPRFLVGPVFEHPTQSDVAVGSSFWELVMSLVDVLSNPYSVL